MTPSSHLRQFLARSSWLLLALTASACFTPHTTTRIVGGRAHEGRYVSPSAYARVMRAALLESQGKLRQARDAYLSATGDDGDSPDIWTRIGAIDCRLGDPESTRSFERAEAIDAHYEPLWRERARCSLNRGNAQAALTAARRAVALDPSKAEGTWLVARSLELLGDTPGAERWRRGFQVTSLSTPSEELSEPELQRATIRPSPSLPKPDLRALDAALASSDLAPARALAIEYGMSASELALRAVEIGRLKQALQQAQLTLSANPSDSNARVAALVAADLSGDEARFDALLVTPAGALQPLSENARALLNALLARRTTLPLAFPNAIGTEQTAR